MNKIVIIFLTFIFSSCSLKTVNRIPHDCSYGELNKDSLFIGDFVNEYKEVLKDNFVELDRGYTTIFYSSHGYNRAPKNNYVLIAMYNDKRFFLYKINDLKQVEKNKEISMSQKKEVNVLLERLEQNLFLKRNCMIEGGSSGVFLLEKNMDITFYYESIGYGCEKIDKSAKMINCARIINHLHELLN